MIHKIPFSELNIWDVKSFFHQADVFSEKHPVVLFGEFLTKPQIEKIKIVDSGEYKILGARSYGKGVFVNRIVKGSTLKMRTYQQAKENHLFWCKVDTKNGAFGIITPELADGVGSSNMTFAKIETNKANPEYVQLLFKSKKVNDYMDGYVSGTTNRKYIKPDQLREEIKIPLPSLKEQNRIVENYKSKLKISFQQEEKAIQLEKSIEAFMYKSLGIEKEAKKEKISSLQFIKYSSILNRWDDKPSHNLDSSFPIVKINDILKTISTGTTPTTSRSEYFENGKINFYTPADLTNKVYLTESQRKVTQLAINNRKARKFMKNTLLFVGIGSTVGKVGIIKNEYASSNQQITGLTLDETKVNVEFAFFYFNYFQHITTKERTQATIPIVNQSKILNIPFPLPPLNIQIEIASRILKINSEINELIASSKNNKKYALIEFEQEIFKS
ncbi:restriction endonuclease subunit S [Polaribacter staleyi]|uniref:restriction endonuclease subunit S n=1 Tax=Polaribacter staleyi TaxID=2022337 RepID=UPI0031BB3959